MGRRVVANCGPVFPAQLATLATGAWFDAGSPVVLPDDSGTGKTHLLIGLGIAACEQGRWVRYATTVQLDCELAETAGQRQLSRVVVRYGHLDLLLPGELGYVQIGPAAPDCCPRSSPNATRKPPSRSGSTCRSAAGEPVLCRWRQAIRLRPHGLAGPAKAGRQNHAEPNPA